MLKVEGVEFIFSRGNYFKDFGDKSDVKYENIPELCEKIKAKKNLINPIYLS